MGVPFKRKISAALNQLEINGYNILMIAAPPSASPDNTYDSRTLECLLIAATVQPDWHYHWHPKCRGRLAEMLGALGLGATWAPTPLMTLTMLVT